MQPGWWLAAPQSRLGRGGGAWVKGNQRWGVNGTENGRANPLFLLVSVFMASYCVSTSPVTIAPPCTPPFPSQFFLLKKTKDTSTLCLFPFSCYQVVLLYALLFFSLMLLQKYLCDLYNDEWMMIWLILMVTW